MAPGPRKLQRFSPQKNWSTYGNDQIIFLQELDGLVFSWAYILLLIKTLDWVETVD